MTEKDITLSKFTDEHRQMLEPWLPYWIAFKENFSVSGVRSGLKFAVQDVHNDISNTHMDVQSCSGCFMIAFKKAFTFYDLYLNQIENKMRESKKEDKKNQAEIDRRVQIELADHKRRKAKKKTKYEDSPKENSRPNKGGVQSKKTVGGAKNKSQGQSQKVRDSRSGNRKHTPQKK